MARIVIVVNTGGTIENIISDDPDVEVMVADYMVDESDTNVRDKDGESVEIGPFGVVEDVRKVTEYFDLAKAYEGTEGQDRDNYTDEQDRENYTI